MKIIREGTQISQSQKPWTTCVSESEAQGAPWKGIKMTQKQEEKE